LKKIDYKHVGQYVENNLLKGIPVNSDIIEIKLRTLKQRN